MPNNAALRAAVFPLSTTKNLQGEGTRISAPRLCAGYCEKINGST